MGQKQQLHATDIAIEERTAEVLIATPRNGRRAVRIARERWIVDGASNALAQPTTYVLGRLVTDDVRNETVQLQNGVVISAGNIEEAIALFADKWAEQDAEIYAEDGKYKYLRPIT